MSKMSIMSLVLGLLFLGTLFFIIGFLAAVATLKKEEGGRASQSAWQASNKPAQGASPGGKLEYMAEHMISSTLGRTARHELSPLRHAMGATATIVPKPLQPFARYGMGSAHVKARKSVGHLNPFHRGRPGAAQHPFQQPQGVPQQYASQQQQTQVYGFPAGSPQTPYGYQAPTGYPQGGSQAYGPPQPQQMQQSYQQQMPQQQMPQQMMVPQQQMMQPQYQQGMMQQPQQQYQQPMGSPQGYYR